MQEGAIDWYEEGRGCCLLCPDAHPGCLCYDCKCKKCYWYASPYETGDYKGTCEKKYELEEERKEEFKERMKAEAHARYLILLKKKEEDRIYWEEEHPKILANMTIKPMEFFDKMEEESNGKSN